MSSDTCGELNTLMITSCPSDFVYDVAYESAIDDTDNCANNNNNMCLLDHIEIIRQLQFERNNLVKNNSNLLEEISQLEEKLHESDNEKGVWKTKWSQLKRECSSLRRELDVEMDRSREINDEIDVKPIIIKKSKDKNDTYKDELLAMEDRFKSLSSDIEARKKRENELSAKIVSLGLALEIEERKNADLTEVHLQCQAKIRALHERVESLVVELESANRRKVKQEQRYEDMKTILSYGGMESDLSQSGVSQMDVTFDKDFLTESRLAEVNMLYPIDPSLEQGEISASIEHKPLLDSKDISTEEEALKSHKIQNNLFQTRDTNQYNYITTDSRTKFSDSFTNDSWAFHFFAFVFSLLASVSLIILIPKNSIRFSFFSPIINSLIFERTSSCQ
ncbi:uncharacterized protein LOC141853452 [Brevipalpus obovatus]|uniref:uncharacterized protein LOC141853452 n=1 Tax=Brevipalpus obovatus TaxID=246614 RepID=UPI003D9F1AF4